MKKASFVLLICIVICLFTSCAGLGDFGASLTGGYEVWQMSDHDIRIVKADHNLGTGETRVPAEVYAVSWNNDYIFAEVESMPILNVDIPFVNIEPHGEFKYYLIDVNADKVYGPFDKTELEKECAELGVTPPDSWIPVSSLQESGISDEIETDASLING